MYKRGFRVLKVNHSESIHIRRTPCLPRASFLCPVSALWNLKGCMQSKRGKTTDITALYTGPEDEEQLLGFLSFVILLLPIFFHLCNYKLLLHFLFIDAYLFFYKFF